MSILGISGSPRDASTAFVLRNALKHAESLGEVSTEAILLKGKEINFCLHCDYCIRTGNGCIQKDDVVDMYPLMRKADGWLLATPVYQGSLSGQLKAVLDRCRAMVAADPRILENKVGAAIAVGGDRTGGQEPALLAIHSFYMANKMVPVGGGPFGANLGGSVWSRDQGAKGAQEDDPGLESTEKTVERLVNTCRIMKSPDSD